MKVALITGATGDIGYSISKLFAQNGYTLALIYKSSKEKANKMLEEFKVYNVQIYIYQCDLCNNDSVKSLIRDVLNDFHSIDVLVNNAGISQQIMFQDIKEDVWDNMINNNLKSVYNTCHYTVPHMVNKKSGKIINISSVWGMVGASCEVHYSTAKAGIMGFTKALAKELAISNINVNCIAPGVISGNMNKHFSNDEISSLKKDIPCEKLGNTNDVANSVLFLAEKTGDYYYGQVLSPNGGMVI